MAGTDFIKPNETQNDVIEVRSKEMLTGHYQPKKQKGADSEI